jgi:hypothetical protein
MRISLACSLVVLVACGGAQKPATTEADTSSLENGSSASSSTSSDSASSSTTASTSSTPAGGGDAKPAAASSPDAPANTAAPQAPAHPVPATTGSIDGKPFSPKLAQIVGPVQKDGRVLVVLHEGTDCAASTDASISLLVPWKDGYKADLGSLRRAKGANLGEAAFVRVEGGKKKQVSTTFKPTGLVTIVSAPTQKDAVGKLKIDLQSGDYMLAGDLDVKVCTAAK